MGREIGTNPKEKENRKNVVFSLQIKLYLCVGNSRMITTMLSYDQNHYYDTTKISINLMNNRRKKGLILLIDRPQFYYLDMSMICQ